MLLRFAFFLGCCFSLSAQSWDALRGLQPGDRIIVLDTAGKDHKGEFRSYTNERITLAGRKSEDAIDRARVRRVQVRDASRRLRHLAIGAGIGVAVGLTADHTLGTYLRNETGQTSGERALAYIAPIALFGGIAAVLPGCRTVYRTR